MGERGRESGGLFLPELGERTFPGPLPLPRGERIEMRGDIKDK
jgi:hypothetical protein